MRESKTRAGLRTQICTYVHIYIYMNTHLWRSGLFANKWSRDCFAEHPDTYCVTASSSHSVHHRSEHRRLRHDADNSSRVSPHNTSRFLIFRVGRYGGIGERKALIRSGCSKPHQSIEDQILRFKQMPLFIQEREILADGT